MSTVKKFTVVESKWLRGVRAPDGRPSPSALEDLNGNKCCMGFLAEACGVPQEVREEACYFSAYEVAPFDEKLPEALRPRPGATLSEYVDPRAHGQLAQTIYQTNDNPKLSDEQRKAELTTLFAEAGVEVEFVP